MCNLYRLAKPADEAARLFAAENAAAGSNLGAEVYPGYPGLVVESGKIRAMNWGFPLRLKGRKGQLLKPRPVNNARTDKLGGTFWNASFAQRRCLIPLTGWAEAQGPKGAMTRTWLSVPEVPVFAAAGIWRSSDEWGDVYSMVMTDATGDAAKVHTRMPVLLAPQNYAVWLGGEPETALNLCRAWYRPLVVERTDEPWARGLQRGAPARLL